MREVLNAILYQARSGCQWDMLPHDLPAQEHRLRLLRPAGGTTAPGRRSWTPCAGRSGPPPGASPDAERRLHRQPDGQGDRGRRRAGLRRGQEAAGREAAHRGRHPGVAAGRGGHGGVGRRRDGGPGGAGPADGRASQPAGEGAGRQKYRNHSLDRWLAKDGGRVRDRGDRAAAGSVGFVKLPRRWVVERTFAWLGRYRRNSRDYEWSSGVERGDHQGLLDPSDAQAIEPEILGRRTRSITGKNRKSFPDSNNNKGDVNNAISHRGNVVQAVGDQPQARIEQPKENVWISLWKKLTGLWRALRR